MMKKKKENVRWTYEETSETRRMPGPLATGEKLMGRKGFEALAVLLLMLCMLFVSCQQPGAAVPEDGSGDQGGNTHGTQEATDVDGEALAEAWISLDDIKGVVIKVPDGVAKYQYRAIPLFEIEGTEADGHIFGEQLTWRTFVPDAQDSRLANLGYFRQGYWRFEIRTLNRNGQTTMTGSSQEDTDSDGVSDVYLQKGKNNIINITLHPDDGDAREGTEISTGKIKFGFETNWLSNDLDDQYIRIEVTKFKTDGTLEPSASSETVAESSLKYGRFKTMFPLKGGTESSRNWGTGALDFYDTTGKVWQAAPGGQPNKAYYGYSDGWTTVLPGQTDTGILTDQSITNGFTATVPEGRIRFYAETPDLVKEEGTGWDDDGNEIPIDVFKGGITPGNYLVTVKVCTVDKTAGNTDKEIVLGGQTMAVKVVGGEVTTVTGSLLQEKYIQTGLSVTIPDDVSGTLQSGDGTSPANFIVQSDSLGTASITITYVPDDETLNQSRLKYTWVVNGEQVAGQTGASFQYTPSRYGDAKITCIVMGQAGDTGNFGEVASDTVVVRVVQQTGPNI